MSLTEFSIIEQYFNRFSAARSDVVLGIGDDAAIVTVPQGYELAITTDSLISGVHFPKNTPAYDIGYKSVAVNLSDLAAMGAEPTWITLALSMPEANAVWLKEFSAGIFELINRYSMQLIGGDITQGPLSITIQAHGLLPANKALRREGAQSGDALYVTGNLGAAAWELLQATASQSMRQQLNHPEPRIQAGMLLRHIANSAIDISDGLDADLTHILQQSQVGATVDLASLPLAASLKSLDRDRALQLALTAGDDYELCFSVPQTNLSALQKIIPKLACPVTWIGTITTLKQLRYLNSDGSEYCLATKGYQHFSDTSSSAKAAEDD